jgi:ABC-2 type transport system permease protein
VIGVFEAEWRKLWAQLSTRVLFGSCALGPAVFAITLGQQSGGPTDSLLGTWVRGSGYAVSFVVLGFAGYVVFPVLAGVSAGDLFSSEDRYETWKTLLTRSRGRDDVFAGKVLVGVAASAGALALLALSSLAAGLVLSGAQPLVGFSGTVVPSGECLWLLLLSWLVSIPPLLAFTGLAVLFSVVSRSGIVGVLGPILVALAMQLIAVVGSGSWLHMLLVATAFDGWHGLLAAPKFYGPLLVGTGVSLVWVLATVGAAWWLVRRREFAGPPVSSRPGWTTPLRTTLGAAALVALLGAATNLGPTAITRARLEPAIAQAFDRLTLLQQRELGRPVGRDASLKLSTRCSRRSPNSQGPGDDWSCTMLVVTPQLGALPLGLTPVTYDVSVKSNGCYRAQAPPLFVGQQTISTARGRSVINPLFLIYGCFDITAPAPRCAQALGCAASAPSPASTPAAKGKRGGGVSPAARAAELEALHKAEREAGPKVLREIREAERKEQHAAEHPEEEEGG